MSCSYDETGPEVDASRIPKTADSFNATQIGYMEWSWAGQEERWGSETDWHTTDKRNTYQRLAELNQGKLVVTGRRNGPWYTFKRNKDLVEALACQLELTAEERPRARKYFLSLDLERMGLDGSHVAFAVCLYVVHEHDRDERNGHPGCTAEDIPTLFRRIQTSLSLSSEKLQSIYGKVQHKIRHGDRHYHILDERCCNHLHAGVGLGEEGGI